MENPREEKSKNYLSDYLRGELSDAGGPERPNCSLKWPARVRSTDFVRHHKDITFAISSFVRKGELWTAVSNVAFKTWASAETKTPRT